MMMKSPADIHFNLLRLNIKIDIEESKSQRQKIKTIRLDSHEKSAIKSHFALIYSEISTEKRPIKLTNAHNLAILDVDWRNSAETFSMRETRAAP